MFKLCTKDEIEDWVEEANAIISICNKRHPEHSYVFYISNNLVDLAKGEDKLITQEACKKLKGEESKTGITTSTKAFYLGMRGEMTTIDFDDKENPEHIRNEVLSFMGNQCKLYEYTTTPNGLHVHFHTRYKGFVLEELKRYEYLTSCMDKVGHDVCSPLAGTYKDGFKIERVIVRK
tara:strand:+ start:4042 stop:4572 length:531 start_codon:yes stop_codon:yes gene_type:complete